MNTVAPEGWYGMKVAGILTAAVLAAGVLMGAQSCGQVHSGGVGISGSGGGAVILATPRAMAGKGAWVERGANWLWVPAAGAGLLAAKKALANERTDRGDVPVGGHATGHGSVGSIPYGQTGKCRNGDQKGETVLEKWIGARPQSWITYGGPSKAWTPFMTCGMLRQVWGQWGKRVEGKQVLECLTWIMARGSQTVIGTGDKAGLLFRWGSGTVRVLKSGEIISANPAKGGWAKCAAG